MAPEYPPSARMSCAWPAVIRTRLSRSAMFAVNWASCACRCDSCRGFCEGAVLRREELCERALWDIFRGEYGWLSRTAERVELLGCWAALRCFVVVGKAGNRRVEAEIPAANGPWRAVLFRRSCCVFSHPHLPLFRLLACRPP
jgi:hypothetical protein